MRMNRLRAGLWALLGAAGGFALAAVLLGGWAFAAAACVSGAAFLAMTYAVARLDGAFATRRSLQELTALLSPAMEVVTPDGQGPFPVVLQFPGCAGRVDPDGDEEPLMRDYADAAAAHGVATVIVDSHGPRGVSRRQALAQVCTGHRLRGGERAGDVLAALAHIRSDARLDASCVALAGWSHGAWAVMDAMTLDLPREAPHGLVGLRDAAPWPFWSGVKAVHLTYPFCGFPARTRERPWRLTPQARVVMAGEDTLALARDTLECVAMMERSGVAVEVVEVPAVTHAFDEHKQEPGSDFRVARAQADEAHAAYGAWLAQVLGVSTSSG